MNQSNCLKQKTPEKPHKKPQQQTSHSTNKSSNFGENLLNKKAIFVLHVYLILSYSHAYLKEEKIVTL